MIALFFVYIFPVIVAALTKSVTENTAIQEDLFLLNGTFDEAIVDHFDPKSKKFAQRFIVNRKSYVPTKPLVFLYVGANKPMSPNYVPVNAMAAAASFKAAIVYLEHRYFGESFPTEDVSAGTLKKLLTVSQSVEDLRAFGEYLKQYLDAPTLQIVLFGSSYGGTLAVWAREKHSSLFTGAITSSSPFDVKLNDEMYAVIEAEDISNIKLGGSPECYEAIRKAHEDFGNLLETSAGRRQLEAKFKFCKNSLEDRLNQLNQECKTVQTHLTRDGQLLGISIQSNDPNCKGGYCNIKKVCQRFVKKTNAPLDVLADVFLTNQPPSPEACSDDTFREYLKWLKDPRNTDELRMSSFIFCRNLGLRQPCTDQNNCPWLRSEDRVNLDVSTCEALGISDEQTKMYVAEVQQKYGRKTLNGATNVFSINGGADPWWPVSITEPREGVDAYTVPLASHCYWDVNLTKNVYDKIVAAIAKWLKRGL